MKYLIYSILFFALVARADDLLPEGTESEMAPAAEEAALSQPVPPAEVAPSLALPVESPAVSTATAVSVSTTTEVAAPAVGADEKPVVAAEPAISTEEAKVEGPIETPAILSQESPGEPLDETAQQAVPPPVAAPQINYGPSAEEGYGSVGLKNDGQFMEVGGDKKTEESIADEGDRKTSSLPENVSSQ